MYKLTVAHDGATPHFTKEHSDALDAFSDYLSFTDWGFANEYATVNLSMPTGKMYTKIFYREGRRVVEK